MQSLIKKFEEPPIRKEEIFRYAHCGKNPGPDMERLMVECFLEARPVCTYNVCYIKMPIRWEGEKPDLGFGPIESAGLSENLSGCDEAVIFAATIGIGIDRLISKYGRIAPSKCVIMQAIGAERIEALCDAFNAEIEAQACMEGKSIRFRYSPGYKDFTLTNQKGIFDLLGCNTKIGLSLNDSMLMSPSKSVTAVIGIGTATDTKGESDKCSRCDKLDCQFRFWEKR